MTEANAWEPRTLNTVPTAVTSQLTSVTSDINMSTEKTAGFMVWNTTTKKPVFANGSDDNSTWYDAAGSLAHTPV